MMNMILANQDNKKLSSALDKLFNKLTRKKKTLATTELGTSEEEETKHIFKSTPYFNKSATGFFNIGVFNNVADLIDKYRTIALFPEVYDAVQQIVDECVSFVSNQPVKLNIANGKQILEPEVELAIGKEFNNVLHLLDFYDNGEELLKQFFIDGRLFFENIYYQEQLQKGIIGLNLLNPKNIDIFYTEDERTKEEFTIYNYRTYYQPNKNQKIKNEIITFTDERITYAHSNIWDKNREVVLGWLHPALKEAMRLSFMEDAAVIYRLVRAPEKRVFNIDTGNLPPKSAEEYVRRMMEEFRVQKIYDPESGQPVSDQTFMHMLEDFWLPRTADGKGTSVDVLSGGANLGEIEDILYFQRKLYKALNIPRKRVDPLGESSYTYVSSGEINYDEYKFQKMITRFRNRFSIGVFTDILKKNCLLKGIITEKLFDKLILRYVWDADSKFDEANKLEALQKKVEILNALKDAENMPNLGPFLPRKWALKNILGLTENEIKEYEEQIADENEKVKQIKTMAGEEEKEGGGFGF